MPLFIKTVKKKRCNQINGLTDEDEKEMSFNSVMVRCKPKEQFIALMNEFVSIP